MIITKKTLSINNIIDCIVVHAVGKDAHLPSQLALRDVKH